MEFTSSDQREDDYMDEEEENQPSFQPLPYLPFNVQIQETFVIDLRAKRFPITTQETISLEPNIQVNVEGVTAGEEDKIAEAILHVHVNFLEEPRLFDISFQILGIFHYSSEYTAEQACDYLKRGATSILFPFARELLASICIRIGVPALYLPMLAIAQPEEETK